MSDGRSIRLPSANFAQVREPGRNGPAVTRFPLMGRGGSNPPLCTMCQRARIGIAACLRNRCLRVRISPLAPIFPTIGMTKHCRSFQNTRASDRQARFPKRAHRIHTRGLGEAVPYGQNALALLFPAQTREELTIASHPTLDFSICLDFPE